MIILVIQNKCVAVFKLERDAPIAIDPYGPASALAPFERVKPEARNVHVLHGLRGIERGQLHLETVRVRCLYSSQTAGLKVLSQAFVAKRSNQAVAHIQNKTDMVFLVLLLWVSARIGFRAIARVLAVLGPYLGLLKTPCPQTVSNYVSRLSVAKMQTFVQSVGNAAGGVMQTVWLIDISIGLGSGKILSVLALNLKHHQQNKYAPGLADVQCVATAVAESWNGETIADFLRKVFAKVGFFPAAFLKDGGTDLEKAIRLLNEQGSSFQCIDDISHMVANLFKHEYAEDPLFNIFITACGLVSKKLKQTILACLAPPKVSTKARFMNLHRSVEWADKLLKHVPPNEGEDAPSLAKLRASLDQLPACESFIKRFLRDAKSMLACQKILKQEGLNLATYAQCQKLIEVIPASSSIRIGFTDWAKSQLEIANNRPPRQEFKNQRNPLI